MGNRKTDTRIFEERSIWKILLHVAPPVMVAQLIQALYNIVDSFFIGEYSGDGLTALSVIFPIQLIIVSIAVGTGVGINALMSRYYALREPQKADEAAGTGTVIALVSWMLFTIVSTIILRPYAAASAGSPDAVEYAVIYGTIVCAGSLCIFLESAWTKMHQAGGNMRLPMIAQIAGAVTNIILDPLFIFGNGDIPAMGIAGAAYATVLGQAVAAVITISALRKPPKLPVMFSHVKKIYRLGCPSILMQMLCTVYIIALNIILAGFSDESVTVLGLYYKMQSFFFIPLLGLQTCIVPLLSYTYAQEDYDRCRHIMNDSMILAVSFMLLGALCFELIPQHLLGIFSSNSEVISIGINAFHIIGLSFVPAVASLLMPVFFQAVGSAVPSIILSLSRQIFCLIPVFWAFSLAGLQYAWWAFPIAEIVTGTLGLLFYIRQLKNWNVYGRQAKRRMLKHETL